MRLFCRAFASLTGMTTTWAIPPRPVVTPIHRLAAFSDLFDVGETSVVRQGAKKPDTSITKFVVANEKILNAPSACPNPTMKWRLATCPLP